MMLHLYVLIGVLTVVRAAYGMCRVRHFVARDLPPGSEGSLYLGVILTAVAMGVCWPLYWPALLAIRLTEKADDE